MKKIIILLTVFTFYIGHAQFNSDAPWMQDLLTKRKSIGNDDPIKFNEIVDAFNNYWKDKDHTKKGSGYKPFKRWENHWKHFVKEDGTLPTPQELMTVFSQKQVLKNTLADVSNWQSLGPYVHTNTGSWSSGQGRVNAFVIDPNNANKYYVGTPAGGIWQSDDSGATWKPLSDELLQIGVSAIAIDPRDSDVIYIGTGDDDAGDTYSIGVLKSTDGGQTWNTTGLVFNDTGSRINEVYLDPSNFDKVFVSSNRGFYKSTDAGANFTRTLTQDLDDAKLKPGDSNIIYAANNSDVYKSTDNGDTFQLTDTGLPASGGRIALAVTADAPNNVYVLSTTGGSAFQGIYRSTNSGDSYSRLDNGTVDLFNGSTQGWYDLGFEVADSDQNIIYVGTVDIYRSTNGGTTFTKWNSWNAPGSATYTHADIHKIIEINGDMYFGTDGGIYKLANGSSSTVDLTEGLAIGQFYRIAVSPQSSANMVGGLQDNGGYAYSGSAWKNYYGADGMDTAIDPNNPNVYYGFIQRGGGLYISRDGGNSLAGSISGPESGNWITPLIMNKEGELYAGYTRLYKLNGGSFQAISQAFTSNIDGIEIDPIDSNVIYVFVNNRLFKSTDRGVNFVGATSTVDNITSVAVSSTDNSVVYLTTAQGVYKSVDGGSNFSDITFNLPSETKMVVKHQGLHPDNPIYVGTSLGVYRLDDTANTWEPFVVNLPNVPVRDLEINLVDGNITAATYGRGVWRSDIPVRQAAVDLDMVAASLGSSSGSIVCGNFSPSVTIKNNGSDPITSFTVEYTLDGGSAVSQNWTGTLNSNETTDVSFTTLDAGNLGEHELKFTVSGTGDIFVVNNSKTIMFNKNNVGTVDINEFETAADELISSGGIWERGAPTGTTLNGASSGQNVYGTNLDGNYTDNTVGHLVSNCYDLSTIEDPVLKFNMAFDLEENWDFVNVEYSLDNGESWNILGAATDPNWYNSDAVPNGTNCFNCPGAQWTGTDGTMKEYSYNLAALTNETSFIFRFNFVSDQSVNQEGVIIDDLIIDGNVLSIDDFESKIGLVVYPNPSKNIFNIEWKNANIVSYDLYDVTGKKISEKKITDITENSDQIDLSNYAKGMYFLKITLDNVEQNLKLIKN